MKTLLLIGSNTGYREVAEYIKKRGDRLIVTDYLPVEESPAKQLADEVWNISTRDEEAIYQKCLEEKPDGILATTSEPNLETALKLAERLGLPFYISPRAWSYVHDKLEFRKMCKKHGLPVAEEFSEENFPTESDCPVIVKPADNCFNRGITICEHIDKFGEACRLARENSPTGKIVIEKYIRGNQFNTSYIIVDGHPELISLSETRVNPDESTMCYCLSDSRTEWEAVYLEKYDKKVRKLLKDIGFANGIAFFQTIADKETGKIYFLEVNSRLDGLGLFNMLKEAIGVDQIKLITDISLDGKTDLTIVPYQTGGRVLCTYCIWSHKPCVIASIRGVQELSAHLEHLYLHMNCYEGMRLEEQKEKGNLLFTINFSTATKEQMIEKLRYINRTVSVLDTEGEDIMVRYNGPEIQENQPS